jgi:hypothetical protein
MPIVPLPQGIVMSTEEILDAALLGFDEHQLLTILSLRALEDWQADEMARQTMAPHLSSNVPAHRYLQRP